MMCDRCGAEIVTRRLPVYQDDGLIGLPNVVLLDVADQAVCDGCGEEFGISIPDADGLEAAVAVKRVSIPLRLNAQEIRFLRRALGLQAKELAAELEVRPETVSNWETGKDPASANAEKLLRLMVLRKLKKAAPGVRVRENEIASMKIRHLAIAGEAETAPLMPFKRVAIVMQDEDDDEERNVWRPGETKIAASGG